MAGKKLQNARVVRYCNTCHEPVKQPEKTGAYNCPECGNLTQEQTSLNLECPHCQESLIKGICPRCGKKYKVPR